MVTWVWSNGAMDVITWECSSEPTNATCILYAHERQQFLHQSRLVKACGTGLPLLWVCGQASGSSSQTRLSHS